MLIDLCFQEGDHEQVREHFILERRTRVVKPILSLLNQVLIAQIDTVFDSYKILDTIAMLRHILMSKQMILGPHIIFPAIVVTKE